MKALTLYQPWASLLACGAKKYETRSWATKYRGPIAIHAGMKDPLQDLYPVPFIHAVVRQFGKSFAAIMRELPRGAVVATAELAECWEIKFQGVANSNASGDVGIYTKRENGSFFEHISEKERIFGDWTPGRYAWELADVKMLPEPIPCKGKQGLWNWEG